MKIEEIKIKDIVLKDNVRTKNYDTYKMTELMNSIKQDGLLQPIGLIKDNGDYSILFGNRRLMAIKKLGRDRINAVVFENKKDADILIMNMVENMQRVDVSVIEQGRIIQRLQTMDLTLSEVSARLSIPLSRVKAINNIFLGIPKHFRNKLAFMETSASTRKGNIPVSIANHVVSLAREYRLSNDNVNYILEEVKKRELSSSHIRYFAKMLSRKIGVEEALDKLGHVVIVRLDVIVDTEELESLCKKHDLGKRQLVGKIVNGSITDKLKTIIL